MNPSCISQSVVTHMQTIVPFGIFRISSGRYRIYDLHNRQQLIWQYRESCPEYFQGIKFNMLTGECLNRQPDMLPLVEIPEKRKEWRRKLREYKKGLKARLTMGCFDGFVKHYSSNAVDFGDRDVDWLDDKQVDFVYRCLDKEEYPNKLLEDIASSASTLYYWGNKEKATEYVHKEINGVFRKLSVPLRKKFGVFEQEDK